jgi:hypothetical protein
MPETNKKNPSCSLFLRPSAAVQFYTSIQKKIRSKEKETSEARIAEQ